MRDEIAILRAIDAKLTIRARQFLDGATDEQKLRYIDKAETEGLTTAVGAVENDACSQPPST
jgi:hypothetical protein